MKSYLNTDSGTKQKEAVSKIKVRQPFLCQAWRPSFPEDEEALPHHPFLLNPLCLFCPLRPVGPCNFIQKQKEVVPDNNNETASSFIMLYGTGIRSID
jgi:hypothetical protein